MYENLRPYELLNVIIDEAKKIKQKLLYDKAVNFDKIFLVLEELTKRGKK